MTQRGNRRQQTFLSDEDYAEYLALMGQWCQELGIEIWCYSLMSNHVHPITVPKTADGLRRAIGERTAATCVPINFRVQDWRGHLWQGRFASLVMDEPYLLAAARYIELSPVRAGLGVAPSDYRWSSASAHLKGRDDGLAKVGPPLRIAGNWRRLLTRAATEEEIAMFRQHERTGRVLGDEGFQKRLEKKIGSASCGGRSPVLSEPQRDNCVCYPQNSPQNSRGDGMRVARSTRNERSLLFERSLISRLGRNGRC